MTDNTVFVSGAKRGAIVDTDSEDADSICEHKLKMPKATPTNIEVLASEFNKKVLYLLTKSLVALLQFTDEGNHQHCFTRYLFENLNDVNCLKYIVNTLAKKLQHQCKFPRIKNEDLGLAASSQLVKHVDCHSNFLKNATAIYIARKLPGFVRGPTVQTTLEIVLHHTSELPKDAVELWTTFFRMRFSCIALVKRVEATLESGKITKLATFKACGCVSSACEGSFAQPLLWAETVNGYNVIKIGQDHHFPPPTPFEITVFDICGSCFDKGINEACNTILKLNRNSVKLAAFVQLKSMTTHERN